MLTHRITPRGGLLAVALLLLSLQAHAQSWSFDSSAEGWQIHDISGNGDYSLTSLPNTLTAPTFSASGGNPNGFISGIDPSSGTFFFQSPVLGNYSSYAGGTLSFSLKTTFPQDYPSWTNDSLIVLHGGSLTLVQSFSYPVLGEWNNYSLSLAASSFRYNNLGGATVSEADFNTALTSLNVLLISAEYANGVIENTSLDAVAFTGPQGGTPVPEPTTYGLIGAGALAGLAAWRRRRKA